MRRYSVTSDDGDFIETFDKYEAERFCDYKEGFGHEVSIEIIDEPEEESYQDLSHEQHKNEFYF